jgi:hypothetical protein
MISKFIRSLFLVVFLCSGLLIQSCSWVGPSVESQYVTLVKPQAVGDCEKIGETTSKTLSKIVVVGRSNEKQGNELITLAKNQAAVMGGDTIVAKGSVDKGEQTFTVFKCH